MKKIFLAIFALNLANPTAIFAIEDSPKIQRYKSINTAFNEDKYILEALDAIDSKDDKKALESYKILYQNTKKIEYLKEQIFTLMRLENYDDALSAIKEYESIIPNDAEILKAKAYIKRGDLEAALEIWRRILQIEDSALNNSFVAALYYGKKDFEKARAHLIRAYQLEGNEEALLVISSLDLERKKFGDSLPLIKAHFESEMSEKFALLLLNIAVRRQSH